MSIWILLSAIAVLSFSGLPACLFSLRSKFGQRLTTSLMFIGSALGLCAIAYSFKEASIPEMHLSWFLPWGQFAIKIDPISIVFLVPVFVVPILGSIYGLKYWKQSEHPQNGCQLGLFYGLLAGSMALLLIAQDSILFLIAWEIMALAAYFCATCEDDNPEVCKAAGFI
jgi:hydrogenase-4 component B